MVYVLTSGCWWGPPPPLIWSMSLTVLMFVSGYGLCTDFRMLGISTPPPTSHLKHVTDRVVDGCFMLWFDFTMLVRGPLIWSMSLTVLMFVLGYGLTSDLRMLVRSSPTPHLKHVTDRVVDGCFMLRFDFTMLVRSPPSPTPLMLQCCLFQVMVVSPSPPPPHHILLQCCWCLFQVGLWGNSWPHNPPSTHPSTRTPCLKPVTDSVVDVCFRLWSDYGPQDSGEEFPRHQGCHAQHETRRWHRCACQGCKTCEWLKYPFSLVSVI